jgi:hypothetical protein
MYFQGYVWSCGHITGRCKMAPFHNFKSCCLIITKCTVVIFIIINKNALFSTLRSHGEEKGCWPFTLQVLPNQSSWCLVIVLSQASEIYSMFEVWERLEDIILTPHYHYCNITTYFFSKFFIYLGDMKNSKRAYERLIIL